MPHLSHLQDAVLSQIVPMFTLVVEFKNQSISMIMLFKYLKIITRIKKKVPSSPSDDDWKLTKSWTYSNLQIYPHNCKKSSFQPHRKILHGWPIAVCSMEKWCRVEAILDFILVYVLENLKRELSQKIKYLNWEILNMIDEKLI